MTPKEKLAQIELLLISAGQVDDLEIVQNVERFVQRYKAMQDQIIEMKNDH